MTTSTVKKVAEERLYNILLAPQISEKATRLAEKQHQFVFKVVKDATKPEVKAAVEKLFEVKVADVNICVTHAKTRNFKQIPGRRKAHKKAYVALKEGFDIDFAGKE